MASDENRRRGGNPRDIVLSLAVLLIPIALIVGITRACTTITVMDPAPALNQAAAAGRFPVGTPTGLGPDWRPLRAAYTESGTIGTLRVGYLTPDDGAVQLLQTNEDPQALLPREFGPDVVATGPVDLGGVQWRGYRVHGAEPALVVTTGNRTTIVRGQASDEELRTLAGSLR